jgi:hypothetical protein
MGYFNPVIHPLTPSADFDMAVSKGLFQPVKTIKATFGWPWESNPHFNPVLAQSLKDIRWMVWRGELSGVWNKPNMDEVW